MIDGVVASYRITGRIGEGGMGVVYRAQHVLLGRQAAIKVLQPELSRNQEIVGRFFTEARAATAIRHPSIIEIYDFGFGSDGSAYIVMELLEGESLGRRLQRNGALSPANAVQLVRQIAGALGAAHAQGIIHRDLKPDNVFLVLDPEVPGGERIKLLDFGIAKLISDPTPEYMTRTGSLLGTPTYMSPEQCRGVAIDHRTDLYSLGCILFECICGLPPFRGEGVGDVLSAHIHVPPPQPRTIVPGLSAGIEALILSLLAKSPESRPANAEHVIRSLDAVAREVPTGPELKVATSPGAQAGTSTTLSGASTTLSSDRPRSRTWRRPAVVAAALVVPVIAIAILVARSDAPATLTASGTAGDRGEPESAAGGGPTATARDSRAEFNSSGGAGGSAPRGIHRSGDGDPDDGSGNVTTAKPVAPPPRSAPNIDPKSATPPNAGVAKVPVAKVPVAIASVPAGAAIVIDNVELGRAPLRRELPARTGQRLVILRLPGYQDARLRQPADQPINARVTLKKKRPPAPPRPPPPPEPDRGVNPYGY